jgi:hypothetical protein
LPHGVANGKIDNAAVRARYRHYRSVRPLSASISAVDG